MGPIYVPPTVLWPFLNCCKKGPCDFNTEMLVSKVGYPCPNLGQLLASRILYALLVGEKQYEIAGARFCTQSRSKVGQLLVNSSPTPHPMGSCRGLPCNRPLSSPDKCTPLSRHMWTAERPETITQLIRKYNSLCNVCVITIRDENIT